jgi:DNA invertase Pin-like site-specific DNA recombinase
MRNEKQRSLVPVAPQPLKRAAAYVRMSTERQEYSTAHQMVAIREYAAEHDLSIAQVYSDEGISGLEIKKRAGLKQLINDVVRGKATFGTVLVYDISRWGRFQDIDQSAFYEYLCRMNGVQVVYCAEHFRDDRTPLSALMKAIRRVEAADFSRDLSEKVFRGHCNLARRGYVQGGGPRYGLKHVLVRNDGKLVKSLSRRTMRLSGYHVELAPGPKKEVRVVREIFRRYVDLGQKFAEIAAHLNSKGCKTRSGAPWNYHLVRSIVKDEQYTGTLVYNRISDTMLVGVRRAKQNPTSEWIRAVNAFTAIVDPAVYRRAEERRRKERERNRPTDEELLARLRRFVSRHGCATQPAINKFRGIPYQQTYARHFGSMFRALELIGCEWASSNAHWKARVRRRQVRVSLLEELARILDEMGVAMRVKGTYGRFWIENLTCYLQLAGQYTTRRGNVRWGADIKSIPHTALRLVGRLNSDGQTVMDYYLFPSSAIPRMPRAFKIKNGAEVEGYRIRDLAAVAGRLVSALAKSRPTHGLMLPRLAR